MREERYMNPYLAGLLLGLLLVGTFFVTGRGLGASGAFKRVVIATVETIAPTHASQAKFYQEYSTQPPGSSPLKDFLVFEVVGVLIGAFASGLYAGRVSWRLEKGMNATVRARIIGAFVGGVLWGIGSQFARGCTSGAALSGLAVMSIGGILTMLCIFGAAYGFAYFFRKLWI